MIGRGCSLILPYALGLRLVSMRQVCQACQLAPIAFGFLCQACHDEIVWLPKPMYLTLPHDISVHDENLLIVQPVTYNRGIMKRAMAAFKDDENLSTLPYLIHALSVLVDWLEEQNLPNDTVILPMPTTDRRIVKRGFLPVETLARYLSALSGLPLYRGVVRVRDGQHQRHLDKQARLVNVLDAFLVQDETNASTVIIFDDVATTGASMQAVATAILCHNPQVNLLAVCLAHGSGA